MPTRSQVLGYLQDIREATPQDPVTNVQIADYLEALLNLVVADGVTKTTPLPYGSAKGLEIWGTNGAVFGLTNDYLEASIKSQYGGGAPEMELWDVFANTKFSFKDGAGKTERLRLMGGSAWLPANLHVGVGTDRTNQGIAFYVKGAAKFETGGFASLPAVQILTHNDNPAIRMYRPTGAVPDSYIFQTYVESNSYKIGYVLANRYSETTFANLFELKSNGNLMLGGITDNGLAKLQTPSLSLGIDTWQYSSDGQQRFNFTSAGSTFLRVPTGAGFFLRYGSTDNYLITANVLAQSADVASDFTQQSLSTSLGAGSRQFVHRREANNTDYRFFDWDASTARDWWNVYASTSKMSVAQIIHFNYGSNVGIGTNAPNAASLLELNSTTKALRLTRVTTTERNALAAVNGLVVFNTSTNKLNFYNGSAWEAVTSA